MTHPNLYKIPAEVERPIPSTMRNILDWDFVWTIWRRNWCKNTFVIARLETERGWVEIDWDLIEDHWYVAGITCPKWEYDDGSIKVEGPNTTKGVQRWLIHHDVEKSALVFS